MLLHSDGVAEAHSATAEMFGFPRLLDVVGSQQDRGEVIDRVLTELDRFTPQAWEQEDDITLVSLTRADGSAHGRARRRGRPRRLLHDSERAGERARRERAGRRGSRVPRA